MIEFPKAFGSKRTLLQRQTKKSLVKRMNVLGLINRQADPTKSLEDFDQTFSLSNVQNPFPNHQPSDVEIVVTSSDDVTPRAHKIFLKSSSADPTLSEGYGSVEGGKGELYVEHRI